MTAAPLYLRGDLRAATLEGVSATGNVAASDGGFMAVSSLPDGETHTIDSSTFDDNSAENGGAIFASLASLAISASRP